MTGILRSLDTATLHAELRRRERLATGLARMRDRLQTKVVALDARIADWGGAGNGVVRARPATEQRRRRRSSGRGPQPGSLLTVLLAALKDKTMTVTEAAAA